MTLPGDLDDVVAEDHAVIERRFQDLEAGRGDRAVLLGQVCHDMARHVDAEERVVYPALGERGARALREHHQIKELLTVLHHCEPGDARFEETLGRLIGAVRPHAAHEEDELLPELRRRVGGARMAELGRQFRAVVPAGS
ncbi:hemerythrin domain-containing protein [Actinoplanes sp. HUAS TT8]|uniref:hemerythrin domain-containing protein n=1 Tax=Actinoplanes sp. HUAS TT8 TaxID=3447453 RepID=UPI003F51CCBD